MPPLANLPFPPPLPPSPSPLPFPHQQTRCAGAVWLVSLLLQSGRHPRLAPLLPDIQAALSQLLGDPNELTQVRERLWSA